jgi:hypothetical protein
LAALLTMPAFAGPTDDVADALVQAGTAAITPNTLPDDFARLTKFVRHEANGMILYTDGGPTDGYVRHAQAHFDTTADIRKGADKIPLFSVAFELVEQPDFTFDGFAAAMEKRLGTPSVSSNRAGSTFRTWLLKQPQGRTFTIARAQASDNPDSVTVVELIQAR